MMWRLPSWTRLATSMYPPSISGATPWRTAFSTSGCSSILGTSASSVSDAIVTSVRKREPRRVFSIERYCSINAISSESGISSLVPPSRIVLRRSLICESMRVAASGFPSNTSVDTALSALKRKCGLSWYRSALSLASRASASARSSRSRSCVDCCHILILKYRLHHTTSMNMICMDVTSHPYKLGR